MSSNPYAPLEAKLGYQFLDPTLLKLALSHRSIGGDNNERLEFLGDSVLNFVVAEQLFLQHTGAREGQLSRLRANLVKGETLAKIAAELSLGQFLLLGEGERKSGGHSRASILADAVEAILGAIYQESGLDETKAVVLRLLSSRLTELSLDDNHKDSKSQLQEYTQSRQLPLPEYQLVTIEGEGHAQEFTVRCVVAGLTNMPEATDTSRKKAEKKAARLVLQMLAELQ